MTEKARTTRARRPAKLDSDLAHAVADQASEQTGSQVSTVDAVSEARLLATVFAHPQCLDDMAQLSEADFGVPRHALIWSAIVACDATGRPVDAVTVADELSRAGSLSSIGGVAALDAIVSSTPVLDELEAYCDIVTDRALRRRLAAAAHRIASQSISGAGDARELADRAQEEIFAATSTARPSTSLITMPQLVAALHEKMSSARSSRLLGAPTGFDALDGYTGGFMPGQLIVVGARPGVGKSVMLLQMARTIAEATDQVVPFFSYEMSHEEIGYRLLSSATGVPMSDLMRGYVPDGMDRVVAREAEKIAALRLVIDDNPPPTVSGVRSALRKMARRAPIGAAVVDYLQLMKGDAKRSENRTQEVSDISRELKLMAKELSCPVLAASQLNRQIESRSGSQRRPQLSDLRESGSVEQDSNLVLFIHRESLYRSDVPADEAELLIGKNRQGPAGVAIPLLWKGATVHFEQAPPSPTAAADGYF